MRGVSIFAVALAIIFLLACITMGVAAPYLTYSGVVLDDEVDYRYREAPVRNMKGDLTRSARVLNAFAKVHPCPTTLLPTPSCPGWVIQHNVPLACGGADAVSNLSWIKFEYKTGYSLVPDMLAASGFRSTPMGYVDRYGGFENMQRFGLDRVERKINALDPPIPDTANCVNQAIK